MKYGLFFFVVIIFSYTPTLMSNTIHVPADSATIQTGINGAVDGDTVLVAPGTYVENINFLGKAITVKSEKGARQTIIDGGNPSHPDSGSVVMFVNNEGLESVIDGFTLMNGTGTFRLWGMYGGGIICYGSYPTILNNIIKSNTAEFDGGGIYCDGWSPVIRGNIIRENTALDSYGDGGGIACDFSSPVIEDNFILMNIANDDGGGIWSDGSFSTIERNIIMLNEAVSGGGLCLEFSYVTLQNNLILGNIAAARGGGIYCYYSRDTFAFNDIAYNSAGGGGGIYWDDQNRTHMYHCTIRGNISEHSGGGIFSAEDSSFINNCTISGNSAVLKGGGIYCVVKADVTVENSIFWENSADSSQEIYVSDDSHIYVTYSDIEGGWMGEGNIESDPLFVLADKQDYRLLWESPCVDTGDPTQFDPDSTRSDMGAHFFNQNDFLTLYVTPDKLWTRPGEEFGLTYTAINRMKQPETFWCLSQALLPDGTPLNVLGPEQFTLQANYTTQIHLSHPVPMVSPSGIYQYWSQIGIPPGTLYDEDSFKFLVFE